ncbi:hypothetical protein [Atopococcus tabaci]|uniref:hypothetical protein n=1 Tax=Atopococcus tabaci TaxID=269774 RepID=UPI0024097D7C|nr:hypothetical protein [Atopococcus tabaci]
MYISKFFSANERSFASGFVKKKADGVLIEQLYENIAKYANKNNLKIVRVSSVEESTMGRAGVAVIFEQL